jgi:hypothetical protein
MSKESDLLDEINLRYQGIIATNRKNTDNLEVIAEYILNGNKKEEAVKAPVKVDFPEINEKLDKINTFIEGSGVSEVGSIKPFIEEWTGSMTKAGQELKASYRRFSNRDREDTDYTFGFRTYISRPLIVLIVVILIIGLMGWLSIHLGIENNRLKKTEMIYKSMKYDESKVLRDVVESYEKVYKEDPEKVEKTVKKNEKAFKGR